MNRTKTALVLLALLTIGVLSFQKINRQHDKEPWKESQLLNPDDLAMTLRNPAAEKPILFCIGPAGQIAGSVYVGPTREKTNLDKLKSELARLPQNKTVVIYCGCCPFGDCPNIRPAFRLLNEMKFTNPKLLNLPHNLKVDWIDKGFPMSE